MYNVDELRNLIAEGDKHKIVRAFEDLHEADAAAVLEDCPNEEITKLLSELPLEDSVEIFSFLSKTLQSEIFEEMPQNVALDIFKNLPDDDRADLFNELSDAQQSLLLPAVSPEMRKNILKLSAYPEGSVGSITTADFISLKEAMTVRESLGVIRKLSPHKEMVYVIYVLDDHGKLSGTVSLRDLVIAGPDERIAEIMTKDPVYLMADWDKDKAADLISHYDFLALPVLDTNLHMAGIVTVDDAMDAATEKEASRFAAFGGTSLGGEELDLQTSSIWQLFKTRFIWLVVLTVFGIVVSNKVAGKAEILSQVIILAAFMSPITSMGGNIGSQSATLIIRAITLGQVKLRFKDFFNAFKRDIPVAVMIGVGVSICEIILAKVSRDVEFDILLIIGLSMFTVTILGSVIGLSLPFLAKRLGTDPATLCSPLIASMMDFIGVTVYFTYAYIFLADRLA